MNVLIAAVNRYAAEKGQAVALSGGGQVLTYAELADEIRSAGRHLGNSSARALGLALDNSPAWAAVDLAALAAGMPTVPLPGFFSPQQLLHAIRDAGIDCIFTDRPDVYRSLLSQAGIEISHSFEREIRGRRFAELRLSGVPAATLPPGTVKVTYTSGTTGNPKGVCLSLDALQQVASSLRVASAADARDVYLSVLPLATLLENIGGVYVPLLTGASALLPPPAEVGLEGAAKFDAQKMLKALIQYRVTATILTPQLLQALVVALEAGHPAPRELRFVAVGGAPVSPRLLRRAQALQLPVFEGYGLSECASVVALNTPQACRAGSVGKPLPHVRLKFGADGEILIAGATLLGYAGADQPQSQYWPSGDLGYLDDDGYLHLSGRKKNIFITSYGRNVAPEWVERELTLHPAIAQAAVFGEARPWNAAVIVPRGGLNGDQRELIARAVAEANRALPDYARIQAWICADAPFLPQNGQLTGNGRLKRDEIWRLYQPRIDQLYEEAKHGVL